MVVGDGPETVLEKGKDEEKKTRPRPAEQKDRKTPRDVFKDGLKGKGYDEQQDLLSPQTSPVLPSNLPTNEPEVPDSPPGTGTGTDVDNTPTLPGTVLAYTGPSPAPGSKPATAAVKPRALGFKTPALPTTKKSLSKGWREKYRTGSYVYRKQKDVVGKAVLYAKSGKATAPTKANKFKGIELDDPKQNQLEECYLVAGLSVLVKTHPQVIKDAIKPVGRGTNLKYQVTLYEKKGQKYSPVTVTVDSSALYAKVRGTLNVGTKQKPKNENLYHMAVFKGGRPVAEENNFLPSGFTVGTKGTLSHAKFAACAMDVSGTKWLMDASGTDKAGPKAKVMTAGTPDPVAQWPNTYKMVKDGLQRVGVESTHKDAGTGIVTNELWPVILEKAIAQMLGGYQQLFKQRKADEAGKVLSLLTGKDWDSDRLRGSQTALKKKIIAYHKAKRPMIALCKITNAADKKLLGLEKDHYYAILDVIKQGQDDITDLKLRDPRGADSKFGSDGIGEIEWKDFFKHFTWVASGKV